MKRQGLDEVFKDYYPNQFVHIPSTLEELIPAHHPAWTVNSVIDRIDLASVTRLYSQNGASRMGFRPLEKDKKPD